MKKYKRAFASNPSFKFDSDELINLAETVVYVSDRPMFDNLIGEENIPRFEHKIAERMFDFNPEHDIVVYYGDSMIFALMIMYLCDNCDNFYLARYSQKEKIYVIRELAYDNFVI
jgi:hypothetical protein